MGKVGIKTIALITNGDSQGFDQVDILNIYVHKYMAEMQLPPSQ